MNKFELKTNAELSLMEEGGKLLHAVKKELVKATKTGVNAEQIDKLAEELITKSGAKPSFKMVDGYKWSTCISVNEGVVHGIPHKSIVFKKGDVVSIDLGMYYKGFHTDTSVSLVLGTDSKMVRFLDAGKEAFANAVSVIKPNNSYVYDISLAIEDTLLKYGYAPILDLTGHGIGRELHEKPYIPCFAEGSREKSQKIVPGMALAVEVMYTQGSPELVTQNDGWTIVTQDGKIAGLFEDTIIVTDKGFKIIT